MTERESTLRRAGNESGMQRDEEPEEPGRPDDEAPGNYVDDETSESVPEPNEPA